MSIDGEGAGKGDTYRPIDRDKFNKNFDDIDWGRGKSKSVQWRQCPECGHSTFRDTCSQCLTPIP
jgi:hypothetical protein